MNVESTQEPRSRIGAAILGLYAAISICRKEGYDVIELARMVESQMEEWGTIPKQQAKKGD